MQTVKFSCGLWHGHALAEHAPESDLFAHFVFAHKNTRIGRIVMDYKRTRCLAPRCSGAD
jgi:hypothetical protein